MRGFFARAAPRHDRHSGPQLLDVMGAIHRLVVAVGGGVGSISPTA